MPSWLLPSGRTKSENCNGRSTGRPRPTPGDGSTRSRELSSHPGPAGPGGASRMPAVKSVGEPCAGEPHARIEVAAGGNRTSRQCRTALAPPADPTSNWAAAARHLERVLCVFVDHYNVHRPHRSLDLTPPVAIGRDEWIVSCSPSADATASAD